MHDPFIGTWTLNPSKSAFDANHRPSEATMIWETGDAGTYIMKAEGANQNGERCAEQPQTLIPDGAPHPVPNFPGLSTVTTRPDRHTIRSEARREDGTVAGEGSYVVSADGRVLTATTAGFDTQLRRFKMTTVWDKR